MGGSIGDLTYFSHHLRSDQNTNTPMQVYSRAQPQFHQNQAVQNDSSEEDGPIDFAEAIEMHTLHRRSFTQVRDADDQHGQHDPSPTIHLAPWAEVVQQHNERYGGGDGVVAPRQG